MPILTDLLGRILSRYSWGFMFYTPHNIVMVVKVEGLKMEECALRGSPRG